VATLLDLLFKPGISVRILGGSLEQSARMFAYLRELVDRPVLRLALREEPTQRRIVLVNGSEAQVLAQSQRSVRGVRVHKLRCDEVEEFDERVWEAAQLVTRSGRCGGVAVTGSVEAISTMHRPYGLMSKLIAREGVRVFRWSALDVMEKCPAERPCQPCVLWSDCGGRAKTAQGFVSVEEMIRLWQRTSRATWSAEMLCERPHTQHQVFAQFDATVGGRHVVECLSLGEEAELIGGLDFGLRNPLAMVWARVAPAPGSKTAPAPAPGSISSHANPQALPLARGDVDHEVRGRVVEVVDVYVAQGLTLGEHLERMEGRGWARPRWIGVDPAGGARSAQTGVSDIDVLRRAGWRVRAMRSAIPTGLEIIGRRLDHGTLRIGAQCQALIQALAQYHYAADRPGDETPVKDGPDHVCDALRYMLVNLELGGGGGVRVRGY
jgi:hypothetical protein